MPRSLLFRPRCLNPKYKLTNDISRDQVTLGLRLEQTGFGAHLRHALRPQGHQPRHHPDARPHPQVRRVLRTRQIIIFSNIILVIVIISSFLLLYLLRQQLRFRFLLTPNALFKLWYEYELN